MTRKKIKHEQLPNGTKRNTIFRNRADGLLKKAKEFSILCGVETGIIIHTQEENNVVQWPSPEIFRGRLHKFLDFPDIERHRKMVVHAKYLEQVVSDERKNILKSQKKNELKEFHQLMNELIKGKNLNELDLYQLNVLRSHSAEFLKKLQKRDEELNKKQRSLPRLGTVTSAVAYAGTMAAETMLENMKRDAWFIETMFESQDVDGFMVFPPTSGGSTTTNCGVLSDNPMT
ncbi:hypothetical protein BUALT_Bualt07G0071600 [Buddleja alternifolia]|uniref:MADS-box domain-containing protein n=1 Tax=Buddleja alternifolia TaxID=168488 RepID=A0AAV6XJQ7_9LAMI|nr:hypothetical protein BUALT_Bualt07G0071600 [Buddleja alternifolia]